jgi:putative transcriptional regulator
VSASPTPRHHPSDEALVEYASGAASDSSALAYACHVSLCVTCTARVASLEAVGGILLDGSAGVELSPDALAHALSALDALGGIRDEAAAPARVPSFLEAYGLPVPLAKALARTGRRSRWTYGAPGVRVIDLEPAGARSAAPGAHVRLVAFKPGVGIPPHDHGGDEHIVVFTGAIEEGDLRFGRGDIATRDAGERHEQRVAAGEPCIALVVNEGPLLPLTLRGRLLLALARA